MRAYRQLATLKTPEHFSFWLAGVTRRVVQETVRKKKLEPLSDKTDRKLNDTPNDVRELIARLPEEERMAICLFFLQEEDVATTADRLQRSRSGTYALIKQALARLAKWWHSDEPSEVQS